MHNRCPVCLIDWESKQEIPDALLAHDPKFYDSREKAERIARDYGWTPENRRGFSINVLGTEYPMDHPHHYDGVSEWNCTACGARIGAFSGKILQEGEWEV